MVACHFPASLPLFLREGAGEGLKDSITLNMFIENFTFMRINLIQFSLALLLIASMSCKNISDNPVNSWKVGTSSGLFRDFSQEEFDSFSKDGIDFIEIGSGVFRNKSDDECKKWVEDIKEKASNSGIEVWSIHLPFSRVYDISTTNDTNRIMMIKECARIMNLCAPLMPRQFVIHGSAEPIPDSLRAQRLANSVASLKVLVSEAKKVNGQLALECLPRTCLGNTSEELMAIVNQVSDELGVCFDSNHLLKEKPEEFVAGAGNRITTLHISDYDGVDERHWLPGTGIINWTEVVSELVKSGYKGPFMFEASRRKPHADGTPDTIKLTTKELYSSFQKIKENYLKSL